MTEPTQAQIEVAAWLVCPNETVRCQKLCGRCLVKSRKILTAAAGVPEQEHILQKPGQKPDLLPNGNTAAEVGPDEYSQGFQHGFAGYEEAIAATIERCAQWFEHHYPTARTIAFEMRRALKENP